MHKIVILLKSYLGDLGYVERLILSYHKHNRDNIPLYIVVPLIDIPSFEKFKSNGITLFSDESITKNLVSDDSVMGIRPGYINQEIIKLAFWEKKLCENYFCMDSDGVFIRDFYMTDFMYDEKTPYTILAEDNELKVDPEYFNNHWIEREKLLKVIQKSVGLQDERVLTCHAFAIFSCKVLQSLHAKFMLPNNFTYIDLMTLSPYEFSWYNMWLQKDRTIPIEIKEPIIKFFHQESQHLEYKRKGIKINDIARAYIGYNINSNYSRGYGILGYDDVGRYDSHDVSIILLLKRAWKLFFKKVSYKLKCQ
jgi:hypothetical protein